MISHNTPMLEHKSRPSMVRHQTNIGVKKKKKVKIEDLIAQDEQT